MEQFAQINEMFWKGNSFQWIFYASVLSILIFEKRKVHRMVFGVFPLMMLVAVFNPVLYRLVNSVLRFSNKYYVRLFSVVPVLFCMAYGFVLVLNKARGMVKLVGVCTTIGLIIFTGKCIYWEPWMQKAENMQKTPDEVLRVLEAIPREKDNTCVALPDPLYVYARQVDGSIIMPYGRQLTGSPMPLLEALNESMPDVNAVMSMAGDSDVDYIVVNKSEAVKTAFSDSGYKPVGETEDYCIYAVTGVPKTVLTLNDKRQILSEAACDENGNLRNVGSVTVAKTEYEYDKWGNRTKETHFDKEGQRVTTINGYTSRSRTFRLYGLSWITDSTKYLDAQDQPVLVYGRYETRQRYLKRREILEERYFDLEGQPMNRLDTGYATTLVQLDDWGRVISEKFSDTSGDTVLSVDGYAEYTRAFDDYGHIIDESYFGTEGDSIDNAAGFARWIITYDAKGNVTGNLFYNAEGKKVDITNRLKQDVSVDLLQRARRESVANSVGISYSWNTDDTCTVKGYAKGTSWNSMVEGRRPYYLINGETYRVKYASDNVYLRICFYDNTAWSNKIDEIVTLEDTEFRVPQNCGAVIVRLWVAPGTSVNETVHPRFYIKADSE